MFHVQSKILAIKYPPFFRCIIMFLHFIRLVFTRQWRWRRRWQWHGKDNNDDSIRVLIIIILLQKAKGAEMSMHISCTIDISIKYFAHHQHFTTNNNIHLTVRINTKHTQIETGSAREDREQSNTFVLVDMENSYDVLQCARASENELEKRESHSHAPLQKKKSKWKNKIKINTVHILAF